jgi:GNAT superfamily N-acetyltransferase
MTGSVAMGAGVVVRDLHYREKGAFIAHVIEHAGAMDREVGLLDRAEFDFGASFGRGTWLTLRLLRLLGRAPVRFLGAFVGKELVGTTMVVLVRPWAYIAGVGVSPNHRRHGVARALLDRAEAIAEGGAAKTQVLDVEADNIPARRLYASRGWSDAVSVDWWRIPIPGADLAPGSVTLRVPSANEVAAFRRLNEKAYRLELPSWLLLPCELACVPAGVHPDDRVTGSASAPRCLIRSYTGRPVDPIYLLGAVTTDCPMREAAEGWAARWTELRSANPRAAFAMVVRTDLITAEALTSLGAVRVAASVAMSSPLDRSKPTGRLAPPYA